jgi:DNA-binding XRE family transcriptional regulator
VQLVITDRLLGRNQAQYVLDTADSIDEARKILRNEINFVLSDHRVPNQVDNVWGNLEPRLLELGWESGSLDSDSETELHDQIVRLILSLKRLRNKGAQRLSPLFAGPVLGDLANQIVEIRPDLPSKLLIKSLRTALTIISPSLSIEDVASIEDSLELSKDSYAKSEESLRMERGQYGSRRHEIARDICEKLNPETLEIIFQKAHGANQSEIGAVLGLTRQTARFRIEEAQQQLLNEFKVLELDIEESREVLSAMLDILGVRLSEVNA